MKTKNQIPKKRSYVKKSAKWSKKGKPASDNIQLIKPQPKPEEKDNELELLVLMCSVVENWNESQKIRNLNFLFSKYGKYLNQ